MPRRNSKTPELKQKVLLTDEELAHIRKLNKQRAKRMEKDTCAYLNAKRTPMSGAGLLKGDGTVFLPHDQGIAVIECKVSAAVSKKEGATISFSAGWIKKLKEDVNALKGFHARFGFMVIKWHSYSDLVVCIPVEYLSVIEKILQITIPRNEIALDYGNFIAPSFIRQRILQLKGSTIRLKFDQVVFVTDIQTVKEWLDNAN